MPLPKLEDIKKRRNLLNIKQDKLAKEADVTRAMISKIENGHHSISYRKAAKIFDYLETREIRDMKDKKTAGEICVTDLVTVAPYDTIAEVKKRMKPKGLSQLLVYSRGKYVGLITVKILADNKNLKKVGDAKLSKPPIISEDEIVTRQIRVFLAHSPCLLVECRDTTEPGKYGSIKGIITEWDIMDKLYD